MASPPLRAAACASLASALALASPPLARAQLASTFDFEAPAAEQTGAYSPDPGAELSAGLARLATSADWGARAQLVRVAVEIDNGGVETPRFVAAVPTSALPTEFRGRATIAGTDVTAFATDGADLGHAIASGVSTPSGRGVFLVRLPSLPAGVSSFHLYGGDRATATQPMELPYFTDPTPSVRYFLFGALGATSVTVVSMIDGNAVVLGGVETPLDALGASTDTAASLGVEITASGPVGGMWLGVGGDALVPESFAGTSFVIPAPRDGEVVFVLAPQADATLTFASPTLADVTVTAGVPTRVDALVADDTAIVFDADQAVVVVRAAEGAALAPRDITPIPPAAFELLGVGNGSIRVAAGAAGANVTAARSNGTSVSYAVPANGELTVAGGASQGGGDAVRLLSDQPIGAIAYGDGDGGESVAFLPPELLGRELVMPVDAQFVVVASAVRNTTCTLLDAAGATLATGTTGATPPPTPGRLFFGSATNGVQFTGPARLRCDGPVWAAVEDAGSEVEKLMIAATAHRPHPGGALRVTPSSTVETRFVPGPAAVSTPTLPFGRPGVRITRFDATDRADPGGAAVYRVSTDEGASWVIPSGAALVAAPDASTGAPAGDFVGVALDGAESLQVQAVLSTDGLADAEVDGVDVEVELVPPPTRLELTQIPSPQPVGAEVSTTITARDDAGALVPIDGDVSVTFEPVTLAAAQTVTMADGSATVTFTASEAASMAFVLASLDGLTGSSAPFEVEGAVGASSLTIVSGDGQLVARDTVAPEPLVVRLTDGDDAPIAGEVISFVATGGSVSPDTATTDADGRASTTWTVGGVSSTVVASVVSDPSLTVTFGVNVPISEDGGCCSATPGAGPDAPVTLVFLLLLGWLRGARPARRSER